MGDWGARGGSTAVHAAGRRACVRACVRACGRAGGWACGHECGRAGGRAGRAGQGQVGMPAGACQPVRAEQLHQPSLCRLDRHAATIPPHPQRNHRAQPLPTSIGKAAPLLPLAFLVGRRPPPTTRVCPASVQGCPVAATCGNPERWCVIRPDQGCTFLNNITLCTQFAGPPVFRSLHPERTLHSSSKQPHLTSARRLSVAPLLCPLHTPFKGVNTAPSSR